MMQLTPLASVPGTISLEPGGRGQVDLAGLTVGVDGKGQAEAQVSMKLSNTVRAHPLAGPVC